jgi:hypothetical protein
MISSLMSSVQLQLVTYYNWFCLRLLLAVITTVCSLGCASQAYSHCKDRVQILEQMPRLVFMWKILEFNADTGLNHLG